MGWMFILKIYEFTLMDGLKIMESLKKRGLKGGDHCTKLYYDKITMVAKQWQLV